MAVSWAGFAMSFTLLFLSMRAILAVGGYCAEGGPYVIQTHCPGNSGWLTPLSVYFGLASVAIGMYFARGLGASLMQWAWQILFIGLSVNFLQVGFGSGGLEPAGLDPTGLALGLMFLVMGAVPLIIWIRNRINLLALFAGTSRIDGTSVGSVTLLGWKRSPTTEVDGPGLRSIDFLVLVPLWILETLFGVWLGVVWFNA